MDLKSSCLLLSTFIFALLVFKVLKLGLLGHWFRPNRSRVSRNLPPGPWKLPIIGSMHHMAGFMPHQVLRNLAKKYGPLMHLQVGEVLMVVVSSPDIAKEVMQTHDINFASRPELLVPSILSYDCTNIAFSPYNEYHRQLRKICTAELFTVKRVQSFRRIREEETYKLIKCIATQLGSPVDLTQLLFEATCSIISRAAFGKKSSAQERFKEVSREAILLSGGFEPVDIFPSSKFLRFISRTRRKLERLLKASDAILEDIISEHRKAREKATDAGEVSEDIIDVLLKFKTRDDQGFSLTTSNIKAVILDLFAGGGDTAASTVDWAMAEMIRKPGILERAQAEVRKAFDGQRKVREEGLTELKYLNSVIKETLRLHPPLALLLPRESGEKCEINGFEIPKKTRVIINAWAIGRDPEHWSEPETFKPERFLNSPIDYQGNHFELIPFGAGRRMCPGINFGLHSVEYVLATVLYHFDWKLPGDTKGEDLNMEELFGMALRRKHKLQLVPKAYSPKMLS